MALAREDVKKQLITYYFTKDKEVTLYELLKLNYVLRYTLKGNHREIFLKHPHCNPPEKLQIFIRQYVE